MKKLAMIPAAAIAAITAAMPLSVSAEDTLLYGTMNIPYTDFYAAEMGDSACEVDAVTSATKNKVLMNGESQGIRQRCRSGSCRIRSADI